MEIKVENLTKIYSKAEKPALDNMSFSFTPGIYGLLGPNGAGKSTLMNILTCNLKETKGTVFCNGKSIQEMGNEYRSYLGYMPQQQGLYEQFTLLRFLRYMAALKNVKAKEAESQIETLLAKVNLSDEKNKKLGSFSGGMKQRALIAQALLGKPKVLILDEPTAGLDPKERIALRNLISEVATDKVVIMATHVVSDIETISKEIIFLKNGKIVKYGTQKELCDDINGTIYEVSTGEKDFASITGKRQVISISPKEDGVVVRLVGGKDESGVFKRVTPQLEDVYLSIFGENNI